MANEPPKHWHSGRAHPRHKFLLTARSLGQDLQLLAFANIPRPPPEPWQDAHALLRRGVERFAASAAAAAAPAVAAAAKRLTLEWYVDVLARLHVNAFRCASAPSGARAACKPCKPCKPCMHQAHLGDPKEDKRERAALAEGLAAGTPCESVERIVCGRVDTARGPTRERSLAALAAAAVAGASGAAGRPVGSALYLLGSLFNHSCAPNLDVLFPAGDGARPGTRWGVTGMVVCLRIVHCMRTCMLSLSNEHLSAAQRILYSAVGAERTCACP